ncbi:MAG TPA: ABC transporter ATP-binding protein [bacterium]|nr:ABC transporter ATP-binding protein [bacterium]
MIKVSDLIFTYPGNTEPTLRGLEFTIDHGEIFGFLGPSGAGKSTTQNILIGLLHEYQGEVRVLDEALRSITPEYYERVGVAFEFPNFYTKFSALENLEYYRSLYRGETEDPENLLDMVGLAEDAETRVGSFSKGMRMRLNFCRALLNKPELLFLDEPTAGLDPANARRIREIITAKQQEGVTVFLTTHNMTAADALCDRVAFIVDGEIVLIDTPRELKVRGSSKILRIEYRENGQLNQVDFPMEGLPENREFLEILQHKDIETLHSQEATLEDIFIRTTGKQLR